MAKKVTKKVTKRRVKKNVEHGQAHIQSSFNNTIVTLTDAQGNALSLSLIHIQMCIRDRYAAEIRDKRRPEPYKGKGIKYADEVISCLLYTSRCV